MEQQIIEFINRTLYRREDNGYPVVSGIWYNASRRRELGAAQRWNRLFQVRSDDQFILTPELRQGIQQLLFQQFGPGFWFGIVIDRADNHVIRITVRLNRAVTATQEAYDQFIENAEAQDRQSKALARAPDWNAFSGPQIAALNEAGEGFQ
jgi:hypothetical protein